jgi:hypothetical protein
MKTIRVLSGVLLLLASTTPARADFQYTETSQVTGGSLLKMMKVASMFARGDAKRQEQQALQPQSTTRYVKSNKLRIDNPDGTTEIIDLDGQRVISINQNTKTYAVATFEQIQAAMQQAQQQAQQQMQQQVQQNPQERQALQNTQLKITPTVHVTPGTSSRVILGQATNETKVQMDIAMQAISTAPNSQPASQQNSGTATYSMYMDTFVAPSVGGYQEFADFYRKMAVEVGWMKLPSMNVQVDPRMSEGMSELQKNSDALKGFPMLSYVSMALAASPDAQTASQSSAQNPQSNSSTANSNNSSDDTVPTSSSAVVMKGLGGLFGHKKQQQDNSSNSNQPSSLPPNPNPNPNALMEMTTQVSSFSTNSLDASLFDVPAGYTQIQEDPSMVLAGRSTQPQATQK